MKCWICNSVGNSGEHVIKASDLRRYFGGVTQASPLYFNSSKEKNIVVGSIKSKRFKSNALLCSNCNNNRTQPYDIAWEKLHEFLSLNWKDIKRKNKVDLSKIFPGNVKSSMLDVHLYFVKIFGCRIIENQVPIDIRCLSKSLIKRMAHPHVYISIGNTMGKIKGKYAGVTKVSACNYNSKSIFANWFYTVGDISVNVIYSPVGRRLKTISKAWHPTSIHKIMQIAKYERT